MLYKGGEIIPAAAMDTSFYFAKFCKAEFEAPTPCLLSQSHTDSSSSGTSAVQYVDKIQAPTAVIRNLLKEPT